MRLEEPPYLFVQTLLQGWGSHGAGGLGFPTLESLGGQLADAAVRELDERFLDGDLAGRGAAGGVGMGFGVALGVLLSTSGPREDPRVMV